MSEKMIRVLVVDDSRTVRHRLGEVLQGAEGFEVVGEADNGLKGFELCRSLRPDVVIMDMVMPEMDGLSATEQIMAHCPTPILVVSSSLNRGELFQTYEALAAGAVDVLDKSGDDRYDDWDSRLLSTLRIVSKVRVITHPRGRLGSRSRSAVGGASPGTQLPTRGRNRCRYLAIGGSTGGPGAVVEILRGLPADLKVPIFLVLHIGEPFGESLANWLNTQTMFKVRYPVAGEQVSELGGVVIMAPPAQHMIVSEGRLRLNSGPERHSCRPSVDLLFESLALEMGAQTCACLLTGMGKDGAAGLLALRKAGALTIAQDEATSVIYGMPREAALLGAAQSILPLSKIAGALSEAVKGNR